MASHVDVGQLFALFAGLAVATLGIAIVMLFAFSRLTGWHGLASKFPCAAAEPEAVAFRSRGVVLGPLAWTAPPLRVEIGAAMLRLHPRFPFSVAFGGVCLPWTRLHAAEPRSYALFETLELRYGDGESAIVGFLPSEAALAIRERVADE